MRNKKKTDVRQLVYTALFAALIVVFSQLQIPLPGLVPISLATFGVMMAGLLMGWPWGGAAVAVSLLLGAVGLPVFAGFSGGISKLAGMTGGFLLSFPIMAWCAGMFSKKNDYIMTAIGLVVGAAANYAVGSIMFMALTKMDLAGTLAACVIPFIPTAIIKIVLAEILGLLLKKTLIKAGLLETSSGNTLYAEN